MELLSTTPFVKSRFLCIGWGIKANEKEMSGMEQRYPFPVYPLPYSYVSLMPHLDADTLYYHHSHYAAQVRELNRLVVENHLTGLTLSELLFQDLKLPPVRGAQIKNAAGDVHNHWFYFDGIYSPTSRLPDNRLTREITDTYGSMAQFRQLLTQAAESVTGSGWVWLIAEGGGLHIAVTRDNRVVGLGSVSPIFVIDLWEHAYYTMHQFDKAAYINDWFSMINWERADRLFQESKT